MTTSAAVAASVPESATVSPASRAASTAAGKTSKPTTSCPLPARFRAMGRPIWPSPRNATFMSDLLVLRSSVREQLAADDHAHDLVRPLQDLMHTQIAHHLLDPVLVEVTVAAVQLQRLVRDGEARVRGEPLGHRALHGGVGCLRVEGGGGIAHERPRRAQLGGHVG